MYLHANAKLGLAGRLALVRAIEDGLSLKAAAAAFSVSPATAHRWWHRWLEAGEEARRRCRVCSIARAGRTARRASSRLSSSERDLRLPPRDRLGAAAGRGRDRVRALDGLEGAPPGGISRPPRAAREPANRYEWPCPGDLLQWTSAATRASCGPATASPATAPRRSRGRAPRRGSATTTCTRSSTTTHGWPTPRSTTTRAATVTGFVERALAFFASRGSWRSV